jgi:hypothetical protein
MSMMKYYDLYIHYEFDFYLYVYYYLNYCIYVYIYFYVIFNCIIYYYLFYLECEYYYLINCNQNLILVLLNDIMSITYFYLFF